MGPTPNIPILYCVSAFDKVFNSPDRVEFYHDLSISWAHLTQRFMWNFTMTSASVELTWPKGLWGILPLSRHLLSSPEPKVHVEFWHDLGISWSQPDFKDHVRSCHHLGVCFDPDSCLMLANRFVWPFFSCERTKKNHAQHL